MTSSTDPLYLQIQDALIDQIRAGEYDHDSRLPSERELAERFQVSRMTARQALQGLMQKGWAYSQAGKGTFVRHMPFRQALTQLTSFTEDMRSLNIVPSSKVLQARVGIAERNVAHPLGLLEGAPVIVLRRLRLANVQPVAIETCYLPTAVYPGLLEAHDFATESLYETLRLDYNVRVARAEQTIRADIGTAEETHLLAMANEKHPVVMRLQRTTYDLKDQPVEHVISVYVASLYEFQASLAGSQIKVIASQREL